MKTTMTADTAPSAPSTVVYTPAEESAKKSSKRAMLTGLGITLGIVLLGILAMDLMAFAQGDQKQDFGGLAVGQAVPDFTATTVTGESFKMSETKGQPVMLTFWSPECEACLGELSLFQAIADDANADVTMMSIALDATPEDITKLFAQKGLDFPTIANESGDIARQYNLRYIPFTIFINPDGTVDQNMSPDRVSGDELHTELLSWLKTCSGEVACAID